MSQVPDWDTGDDMRARSWDLWKPTGEPEDRLEELLGALGAYGEDTAWQVHQLRKWLDSPAAIPAPPKLRTEVEEFLRQHG